MKRIAAFVAAILLLFSYAISESTIDIKALTDAELKTLYISVKDELMERKLWESSTLPAGMYQAGKGLPEGTYECTAKSYGMIFIYKDYQSFLDDKNNNWFIVNEGDMFTLALYGDVVYYVEVNSIVRPFVGLSW